MLLVLVAKLQSGTQRPAHLKEKDIFIDLAVYIFCFFLKNVKVVKLQTDEKPDQQS